MKTPAEVIVDVTSRLRRSWAEVISDAALHGQVPIDDTAPVWPHRFPIGAPSRARLEQRFADYQSQVLTWRQWQANHAQGQLIEALRRVHNTSQAIPTHLVVVDVDAAAAVCDPEWEKRLSRGRHRAATLLEQFQPGDALRRILRETDDWTDIDFALLCRAAEWFRDHDANGLTPRQVPVPGMHAKWLNTRQHLVAALAGIESLLLAPAHPARVHLTYLDPDYRATGGRLHDCISIGDSVHLPYKPQTVVISENKDTAIAFPTVPGGICVEGGGFGGAAVAALPGLIAAPTLVYWGDIDAAGFEILDGYRAAGVPATSMLMDIATFERYEQFGTSLDPHGAALRPRPRRDLLQLTDAERAMYEALIDPAWTRHRRLEQERIPLPDALVALLQIQRRRSSGQD